MHVQERVRDLLSDCLTAWDGETNWWARLARVDPSYFIDHKRRKMWAEMNKEDRARWLIGQLWNCTDHCPRDVAGSLDIPGGTYASLVRRLAVTDPPDEFGELIRHVEQRRQRVHAEAQAAEAAFSSP